MDFDALGGQIGGGNVMPCLGTLDCRLGRARHRSIVGKQLTNHLLGRLRAALLAQRGELAELAVASGCLGTETPTTPGDRVAGTLHLRVLLLYELAQLIKAR